MADMTEQAARSTVSPLIEKHDPEALIAEARGEESGLPGGIQRAVSNVADNFGQTATVDLISQIAQEREQFGELTAEVEEQATFGGDGEEAARASEEARQERERQREAERPEEQMDIETAAATQRLTEFEGGEGAEAEAERREQVRQPTRVEGREPDQGPDEVWSGRQLEDLRKTVGRWVDPDIQVGNGSVLRTADVPSAFDVSTSLQDAAAARPVDFVEHFERRGDFEDIEGIGPRTSDLLEALVPLVRDGLEDIHGEAADLIEEMERGGTPDLETRELGLGGRGGTFPLPVEVNGWELFATTHDSNPFNQPGWRGEEREHRDEWVTIRKWRDHVTVTWHSPRLGGNDSSVEIADVQFSEFRDEDDQVVVDEVVDTAVDEAVEWLARNDPGEFRHPEYEPSAVEKLPPGWNLFAYDVNTRKTRIVWRQEDSRIRIEAEGFPGTDMTVLVKPPGGGARGLPPEEFGVVVQDAAPVFSIIERMRRIAEAMDVEEIKEEFDIGMDLEDSIRAKWPELPGNGVQALVRNFDSMDEIMAAPVGEVFDISGVGRKGIDAIAGTRVDPRSKSITVRSARERERRAEREDEEVDEPVYSPGDRVEHSDGRTGTVRKATADVLRVIWDSGRDQGVSPAAVSEIETERGAVVTVQGSENRRSFDIVGSVPDETLDRLPDERQMDNPEITFIEQVRGEILEALGTDLDDIEQRTTAVGALVFQPGGSWRFVPRDLD